MNTRTYLLFLVASFSLLSGCGSNSSPPEFRASPVIANDMVVSYQGRTIYTTGTVSASYFDVTVQNTGTDFTSFVYKTDSDTVFRQGTPGTPISLYFPTDGDHLLTVIGGINSAGSQQKQFRFTIDSLPRIAGGKHEGDYVAYTPTPFSNMSVGFANYSGLRTAGTVTGNLSLEGWPLLDVSGSVGATLGKLPARVQLQLISLAGGPASLRMGNTTAVGNYPGGYYHAMNLDFSGADAANATIKGNLRLYRQDIGRLFRIRCPLYLYPNAPPNAPDLEGYLTLYTFNGQNFEGHIRLANRALAKVLTYDVKGDTSPGTLSLTNNSIKLTLEKPFGALTGTYTLRGSDGYLTVDADTSGMYRVSQMHINLSKTTTPETYDALGGITTIRTFQTSP